ncbi:sensor histidine kinase [Flavobacterium ardleyense]|uniref:histidine kinase n=1 Tax=Flavobacterium ardleyense TaxID=2038737 RepID=A0ABW5Z4X4_9FLAO
MTSIIELENTQIINAVFFILLAFASMFLILVLFFYFSRKKIVQIEVDKKMLEIEHQKELLESVIVTQEEERQRIAQDLHDDISSKLNVVSINTHLLRTPNLTVEETNEITSNIINYTQNALENSRRIAHNLLPPVLEKFGFNAGIEELVEEYNSTKKVKVVLKNELVFDKAKFQKHLHIFRILQELLNNSIKHGKATEVSIQFTNLDDEKVCIYKDNGKGFDVDKTSNHKGLGMRNIESRISFIGGAYSIDSTPNEGVKVIFNFK